MKAIALRLRPNDDVKASLVDFMRQHTIEAACILTCVGSLRHAALRLADHAEGTTFDGPFEIVSLTGTLSQHGEHIHICLADGEGRTIGGHLLDGCTVYTTAEIVLGVLPDVRFVREHDPLSGYDELVVQVIE